MYSAAAQRGQQPLAKARDVLETGFRCFRAWPISIVSPEMGHARGYRNVLQTCPDVALYQVQSRGSVKLMRYRLLDTFVRPVLFRLDPEDAHEWAIRALKVLQKLPR